MATITFLSPRRGTGTTTALAAATNALRDTATKVTVIDRTANNDFTNWWPKPPPEPARIDAELTLIDAHTPDPSDEFVVAVFDLLTEPDPVGWLNGLQTHHPHLTIIGAIANRCTQCPTLLALANGPEIRVKPLPHHHLFREAALQQRWPLDLSALGQPHIAVPTLALGPHINIGLLNATALDETTPAATVPTHHAGKGGTPGSNDAQVAEPASLEVDQLLRRQWSVPPDLKAALWSLELSDRRATLAEALTSYLSDTSSQIVPAPETPASGRQRIEGKWPHHALDLLSAAAEQHECSEYQLLVAALRSHFGR